MPFARFSVMSLRAGRVDLWLKLCGSHLGLLGAFLMAAFGVRFVRFGSPGAHAQQTREQEEGQIRVLWGFSFLGRSLIAVGSVIVGCRLSIWWYQKGASLNIAPGSNECGSLGHCARFVFLSRAIDQTGSPSNVAPGLSFPPPARGGYARRVNRSIPGQQAVECCGDGKWCMFFLMVLWPGRTVLPRTALCTPGSKF